MPYTIHTAKAKIRDAYDNFHSIDVFSNEENYTINATLSTPLSIGGGWVDITLDKTNAEILAAAPLGRMVINIPFGD